MAHIKRLAAPKSWGVPKKKNIWITRPDPGPHNLKNSIPLNIVLKNLLEFADSTKESKKIISSDKILVDNTVRHNHRLPMGIMDIITIPEIGKSYMLLLDKHGKFKLSEAKHKSLKYCKILDKTTLRGGKTQLNLSSGRNLIIAKDEYNVGDTITLDLSRNKLKSHLKLEKGSLVYISAGKHLGYIGKILEIHKFKLQKDKIKIKLGDEEFETLKEYAFVIDKQFAENEGHKSDEKDKD